MSSTLYTQLQWHIHLSQQKNININANITAQCSLFCRYPQIMIDTIQTPCISCWNSQLQLHCSVQRSVVRKHNQECHHLTTLTSDHPETIIILLAKWFDDKCPVLHFYQRGLTFNVSFVVHFLQLRGKIRLGQWAVAGSSPANQWQWLNI